MNYSSDLFITSIITYMNFKDLNNLVTLNTHIDLNIYALLIALETSELLSSEYSIIEIITIKPSKILNESYKYPLTPNPNNLNIISIKNINIKKSFKFY